MWQLNQMNNLLVCSRLPPHCVVSSSRILFNFIYPNSRSTPNECPGAKPTWSFDSPTPTFYVDHPLTLRRPPIDSDCSSVTFGSYRTAGNGCDIVWSQTAMAISPFDSAMPVSFTCSLNDSEFTSLQRYPDNCSSTLTGSGYGKCAESETLVNGPASKNLLCKDTKNCPSYFFMCQELPRH